MIQITLTKVEQWSFELFKTCLSHYVGTLEFLTETSEKNDNYIKDCSIATELWYDMNKRTVKQFPAEKSTIKLAAHKAFVLRDALHNYSQAHNDNPLEKSRCNRFYIAIDEQLPTPKLVASNFKH